MSSQGYLQKGGEEVKGGTRQDDDGSREKEETM